MFFDYSQYGRITALGPVLDLVNAPLFDVEASRDAEGVAWSLNEKIIL